MKNSLKEIFTEILLFIRRFYFLLHILLVLYTLLVYQISFEADIKHWTGGFLMMSLPVVWVIHIVIAMSWIIVGSWRFLLSALVILIGFPFGKRTFRFNPRAEYPTENTLSVLSYNMMYIDYHKVIDDKNPENTQNLVASLPLLDSDIECYQELYNNDAYGQLALIKKLKKTNTYYTYMHSSPGNDRGKGQIGLAIFSKYPLKNKRELYWKRNNNGAIAVDVMTDKGTFTVINTQMHSMGIRVGRVLNARSDEEKVKKETKNIISQLKAGFEERVIQTAELEKLIHESKYPVILCGDFNELPYGYAYGRIRKLLQNTFEEKGRGFGFTYHHLPGFLRIDQIFVDSNAWKVEEFKTLHEIPFSDHYPIRAVLSMKSIKNQSGDAE
ncbi:MAG: endonuclease/exonuclease/phosphatase family protein [Spirosomataceae bacterium]